MNKSIVLFTVLAIALGFGFAQNGSAQSDAGPPILMQPALPPAEPVPPPPPPETRPPVQAPRRAPEIAPPPQAAPLPRGPQVPLVRAIGIQNLQAELPQAVDTARKLAQRLEAGKVWWKRNPSGELEIKAGLLYQGIVVAVLHFDPFSGNVLPLGLRVHSARSNIRIQTVRDRLDRLIRELRLIPAARFQEPGPGWVFPLALGDRIVARIGVYYDGIHVLQDVAAHQEMMFYGR